MGIGCSMWMSRYVNCLLMSSAYYTISMAQKPNLYGRLFLAVMQAKDAASLMCLDNYYAYPWGFLCTPIDRGGWFLYTR